MGFTLSLCVVLSLHTCRRHANERLLCDCTVLTLAPRTSIWTMGFTLTAIPGTPRDEWQGKARTWVVPTVSAASCVGGCVVSQVTQQRYVSMWRSFAIIREANCSGATSVYHVVDDVVRRFHLSAGATTSFLRIVGNANRPLRHASHVCPATQR